MTESFDEFRIVTIKALERTVVTILPANLYKQFNTAQDGGGRTYETMDRIFSDVIPTFGQWGAQRRRKIIDKHQEVHVQPGTLLLLEGSRLDRFLVVIEGSVDIYKRLSSVHTDQGMLKTNRIPNWTSPSDSGNQALGMKVATLMAT